jgi:hypothetical protein
MRPLDVAVLYLAGRRAQPTAKERTKTMMMSRNVLPSLFT